MEVGRLTRRRFIGGSIAMAATGLRAADADLMELRPGAVQLFLDDYAIESMEGLERGVHQPRDIAGNPVLMPEHPWEHRRIPFGSVIYSEAEGKFRCWYLAMNIYDSRPGFRGYRKEYHVPIQEAASICYAESGDGIHWEKPELGLHEFRGSKKNNIVLRCPGTHFDSTSVMHTPGDTEYPWKMMSFIGLWPYKRELIEKQWGNTEFGISRHGHYGWRSRDGIRWEMLNEGAPVLRASDRSMFWWDAAKGRYGGAVKMSHEGKRAQRLGSSEDLVNWKILPEFVLRGDAEDLPGDEGEAAYGFRYGAQYVGFAEIRRTPKGESTRITWELLSSRDGREWSRPIRRPFLEGGPKEGWRYEFFKIFASAPIERDGELFIYYGGKTGLNDGYTGTEANQAMCLAKLRRDGFVSLDAGEGGGELTTRAFRAEGEGLFLNLAARKGGGAIIEVRDEAGRAVAGFGPGEGEVLAGDSIHRKAVWKGGATWGSLKGKVVKLKVRLKSASLYSLGVE